MYRQIKIKATTELNLTSMGGKL